MKTFKYIILSLFCCATGLASPAQALFPDSVVYQRIEQLAKETERRYAPDKRTAIFELHVADSNARLFRIVTTEPKAGEYFNQLLAGSTISSTNVTINLLPDSSIGGNIAGIVNLSVANLRVEPSNQAELASQALLGTQVDLLQEQNGYYRIRTPEGYISWVSTSSVTPKSTPELIQWREAKKVIFIADFGHAYTMPDEQSLRVSDLVMGNILLAGQQANGFVQVRYPDGRDAYIKQDLIRPFDEWLGTVNPTAEAVLKTAKTMMGVPYLWGGTSVKGVDCSGFTKTAYYMNGIVIPRDASQQVLAGQFVDILSADTLDTQKALQNLQPADLLFFASGKNRDPNARVTHVALYLGNGEFIHSAGTVRINSMLRDAPNYEDFETRTLVAARRYIRQSDPALQPVAQHPAYTLPTEKLHE
ncbi:C40 family peptidase [Parapedobacter koreensis]|uniref:SH3 domain-containing protein n=1 Tax=Parapedobacter koreensis TaxID=332977 RepID=A0A1H7S7N0_9SPHI|nr:C40 family peptidase [Parapedobacter koreensis]SEL68630.1 SH3 domain-containing protein [Parapedobacter koreensis]